MKHVMTWILIGVWLPGLPAPATAASSEQGEKTAAPRVIKITGTDDMTFNPATIEAAPGERLRVELTTISKMPKIAMAHNVVMLEPGSDEAAFVNASAMARDADFIAPQLKDQVFAASGLAGADETVTVEFEAPAKPGRYTFICTFPGHYMAGMTGVLIVKGPGRTTS